MLDQWIANRKHWLWATLLGAGWLGSPVQGAGPDGEPYNVIFYVLDTTRADHFSLYGYGRNTTPFVDSIAKEGLAWANCTASSTWTWPSVASILTGLTVQTHKAFEEPLAIPSGFQVLPEMLAEKGYSTHLLSSNRMLQPVGRAGKHFQYHTMTTRPDQNLTDRMEAIIREPSARPFFIHAQPYAAHAEYLCPAPFDSMFVDDELYGGLGDVPKINPGGRCLGGIKSSLIIDDIMSMDWYVAQYDGLIAYMDYQIEQMFQMLEEEGLRENTLIVITSDHGEELAGDHNYYFCHTNHYQGNILVPLVMVLPESWQEEHGPLRDHFYGGQPDLVDIMPTVLNVLGYEVPEEVQGRDLLVTPEPDASLGADQAGRTLMTPTLKLIQRARDIGPSLKNELYDLVNDPGETTDLAPTMVQRTEKLESKLLSATRKLDKVYAEQPVGTIYASDLNDPAETEGLISLEKYGPGEGWAFSNESETNRVLAGQLSARPGGADYRAYAAIIAEPLWDYNLSCRFALSSGTLSVQTSWVQWFGQGYRLLITADGMQLVRYRINSSGETLAQADVTIPADEWQDLFVGNDGDSLTVELNGTQVFKVATGFLPDVWGTTYFSIPSTTGGVVYVDDISVSRPGGPILPRTEEVAYEPFGPLLYQEVSDAAGLGGDFRGWGINVADFDSDGLPDLYFNQHETAPMFYRNDAAAPGTFSEETLRMDGVSNFNDADQHTASILDVDGDGCVDMYQTIGSSRGVASGKNWFISMDCDYRGMNKAEELGMADEFGRGRTPIWFDYDLDGVLDLLLLNAKGRGGPSRLYQGLADGKFSEISDGAGLPLALHLTTGEAVDLDGDLDPDLILGGKSFGVFENNGDGTFTDVSAASKINVSHGGRLATGDFNGDRLVDMFVVGDGAELDLVGQPTEEEVKYEFLLYGPDLKGLRMTTDSDSVWISPALQYDLKPIYTYFGAENVQVELPAKWAADDPALVGEPSLMGSSEGTFIWRDAESGDWNLRMAGSSDEAVFDVCRGWLVFDQPVTVVEEVNLDKATVTPNPSYLYVGNGDLTFQNESAISGIRGSHVRSRDLAVGDLDNDGDLDVYVVNGDLVENTADFVFINDGFGRFTDLAQKINTDPGYRGSGSAVALADFDRNGELEILVENGYGNKPFVGPRRLFRPVSGVGNWLQVVFERGPDDPTAIGARVEIEVDGRRQIRHYDAGQGNVSQDQAMIHFGLGDEVEATELVIHWTNGTVTTLGPLDANQRVTVPTLWSQP